ncbi:unnamed protein product [marine sediment metagenome]|uniref:Uncharacterized protein n=1 Tax=marine sediment metagenome TaxID=412755 RepID=X1EW77_9ZZZZ
MSVERERLIAWKKTARGKGLRWQILRDVVACCRLHWITFEELSHVMMRLRGLTRSKLREMLAELRETGDLDHVQDKRISRWVYGTTVQGAGFWINGTVGIPAGIVEAVAIMRRARALELGEVDESNRPDKVE